MEVVLEARIEEYRFFLVALFSVRQRQRAIVKPGVDESLLVSRCDEALGLLPSKMRKVLRLRFGLDDGLRRTQPEIGCEFSVTRQQISKIEIEALKKLRHHTRSKGLKEFIDYVRRN